MLTEGFAQAFGTNVRVNTIQAGPFLTDISANWPAGLREELEASVALQRCAEPQEIVGAALFFAGSAPSYATGAVLRLDGATDGQQRARGRSSAQPGSSQSVPARGTAEPS